MTVPAAMYTATREGFHISPPKIVQVLTATYIYIYILLLIFDGIKEYIYMYIYMYLVYQ